MGKRKNYKQAFSGFNSDGKRFKYSSGAINSKDSTRGFLLSYRRNCLKGAMREAFDTTKYFIQIQHPGLFDDEHENSKEGEQKVIYAILPYSKVITSDKCRYFGRRSSVVGRS